MGLQLVLSFFYTAIPENLIIFVESACKSKTKPHKMQEKESGMNTALLSLVFVNPPPVLGNFS